MSSKRYAVPLRLEVGPSPRLRYLFRVFVVLSLFAVLVTPLALLLKLAVAFSLLVAAYHSWRQRAELGGGPVKLVWQEQGWLLCRGEGEQKLSLDGHTFITPSLLLLSLHGQEGSRDFHAVLFRAEHDRELMRRMRVRLLIEQEGTE